MERKDERTDSCLKHAKWKKWLCLVCTLVILGLLVLGSVLFYQSRQPKPLGPGDFPEPNPYIHLV